MRFLYVLTVFLIFFGCQNENENKHLKMSSSENVQILDSAENITVAEILANEKVLDEPFSIVSDWKDSLFLFGKHKLNVPVFILNHKSETIFETKTIGYKVVPHVDYDIWTSIENRQNFDENYCIAIFGKKPIDYKEVKSELVVEDKVNYYDSLLKRTTYIDTLKLLSEFLGGKKGFIPKPEIKKFRIYDRDLFVLTYIYDNQSYGPRFTFYNNKFKLLNKEDFCSTEAYFVFYMDGNYYIQNETQGCGTGVYGLQIFKLTNNSIIDYFEDFGLSD